MALMPPKAKVRAKAKAKGFPMRRPARVVRPGGLRRPAAAPEGDSPWKRGLPQKLVEVPLTEFATGLFLVAEEADYFGGNIKLAGEITKLEVEKGETTLYLHAKGTDSEALLKAHTSQPQTWFKCHVCPEGCTRQVTGDYVVHLLKGRKGRTEGEEEWTRNLEVMKRGDDKEDELGNLRRRSQEIAQQQREEGLPPEEEPGGTPKGQEGEPSLERKKKKKKEKKKKKKKDKGLENGRHPALAAQKEVKELYQGTGLDPREHIRRRIQKKAQKFLSKKRSRSSSGASSGSSSTSSPSLEEPRGVEGVFTEDTKVRALAERYPGTLAVEAISAMRRSLLTTSGEEMDESAIRPVALLYYRTVLARRTSGPQSREMLNLSAALDLLVRGKPACAADLIAQRLKAQEAVSQGTSWAVAQRMELPPPELPGLVARAELASARKEEYEEARTRWRAAQGSGGGKNEHKGKGKSGKGEGQPWRREDRRDDGKDKQKGKGQEKKGG